tara:strand:+ start:77 stop:655 length:579 start_codon:yes stop_codon:yes gene_type:complete
MANNPSVKDETVNLLDEYMKASSLEGLRNNYYGNREFEDPETRLTKQSNVNEQAQFWGDFLDKENTSKKTQEPEQDLADLILNTGKEVIPTVAEWSAWGYTKKGMKKLAQKGVVDKLAKKGITRGAGYLVPGAGQMLLATDALDFLLPEGYSPYEGFGLAPNNPVNDFLSLGNVREIPEIVSEVSEYIQGDE